MYGLAKVSDRNSFRANQNYSDSFRYMHQSQCESFRTNPKNVLWFVWWKTVKNRSDLIRFNLRQLSEWIRTNSKPSFQSELGLIQGFISIRINPNHFDFGFIRIDRIRSDWFFTVFHQTSYKTFFGLVRNDSHWLGYRYRNESE